nr:hypothetical protein B0A51_12268 [Rachicladosporium sp. CCFEE 5018]
MGKYSSSASWSDIAPLPLDEGGPNPLAAIAYTDEYCEAMSYLRAIMAATEHSERVLDLTEDIIDMNAAHYTVWLYRAATLFTLESDLKAELEWVNDMAQTHQKNYQIWNHRNMVVDRLGSAEGEASFVEVMLGLDAKNYHVWSYRQWLVKRFGLWEEGEMEFVERMLERDVRNNSAWNHRWFIVNGREAKGVKGITDQKVRDREVVFAEKALERAPQNPSPWNYLRGTMRAAGLPLGTLKETVVKYADLSKPDAVRSSHALDLLADILAEEESSKEEAVLALDLLAEKYDPVRKNYWEYRKGLLGEVAAA